jgi:Ca-activated chloride channel family protein
MDIQYGNLEQLGWLWLVATCGAVAIFAAFRRIRARRQFATANLIGRVLPPTRTRRNVISTVLVVGALSMMVLALVDFRWGKVWREVPQKGIELMFVLDVSRSMLADDCSPNRLERAKQQIKDAVDEMAGNRVGLMVFAGDVKQQIPLTTHYDDFKQMLDEVGPHNVRRGGSRLGDAIDAASHAFLTKSNAHKAMMIFTDGEDQESKPVDAARRAHKESGVRIFTIGLGDMEKGSKIPVHNDQRQEFVKHDGEPVWSKLNGEILRQVATESEGAYIPAGTKQVNMADVYHGYIAGVEQEEFETARINQYEARFQWFLAVGLLLLLLEVAISSWPVRGVAEDRSIVGITRKGSKIQPVSNERSTPHSTAA